MDLGSILLSFGLFIAFVPGVLVRLPPKGTHWTVILTHALLFAVVTHFVMRYYWINLKGYIEMFGNYGPTCPNGYVAGTNQAGKPDCVPAGRRTY